MFRKPLPTQVFIIMAILPKSYQYDCLNLTKNLIRKISVRF